MLTSYQYSQYSEKAPTAASHIRRRHQLSYLEGRYGWTLMLAGNFYKAKVIKYCEHLENSSGDYECDRDQGPGQQLVCRHRPSLGPPAASPARQYFILHSLISFDLDLQQQLNQKLPGLLLKICLQKYKSQIQ